MSAADARDGGEADERENIEGGVRHLRHLVDRYGGNLALALAAYNVGADAVARYGGVPTVRGDEGVRGAGGYDLL